MGRIHAVPTSGEIKKICGKKFSAYEQCHKNKIYVIFMIKYKTFNPYFFYGGAQNMMILLYVNRLCKINSCIVAM